MQCRRCLVLALGAVVSLVAAAQAQQSIMDDQFSPPNVPSVVQDPQSAPPGPPTENWWQRWKRDYHRNQCWPEPFIAGDRQAVKVPFEIMADNAWQRQLLLSDYHFIDGTTELNDAGKHKLLWIVMRAPAQRKKVYVETLPNEKTTNERIASVQKALVRLAPNYPGIPVSGVNLGPGDWSGEAADTVQRNTAKTMPDPRLPTAARTTISQ